VGWGVLLEGWLRDLLAHISLKDQHSISLLAQCFKEEQQVAYRLHSSHYPLASAAAAAAQPHQRPGCAVHLQVPCSTALQLMIVTNSHHDVLQSLQNSHTTVTSIRLPCVPCRCPR
jgi:hypothetical protein